jgi:hypothetical protein
LGLPAVNLIAVVNMINKSITICEEVDKDLGESTWIGFDPIDVKSVVRRINDKLNRDIFVREITFKHFHRLLDDLGWLRIDWGNKQ